MPQPPSTKGDPRAAAQRIERGIERYAEGDLAGALDEFEEALKLYPSSGRARQYTSWVRDVQTGARSIDPPRSTALDEDALRAVNEALGDESTVDRRPSRARKPPEPASSESQTGVEPPTTERRSEHVMGVMARAEESPWDPVPLTPGGSEAPEGLQRQPDRIAELQSSPTKAVPPPPGSSSTILGMPPLEPSLLSPRPKRQRVVEDRPESVTREFHSATPTGPNLRPLDVPELTDEQIQGLLALDSPLLPEGRTTPELELDRISAAEDSLAAQLIELEAVPTPLPTPAPAPAMPERPLRKNDTSPTGVEAFPAEFEPQQLTPTGIKATGPKPVRDAGPEDDPYADLNLLPLEVAPDLAGPDEVEDGGTNPTNPFIRGAKLATYVGHGTDPKLEELPPLPTLPGARGGETPLSRAEAALQAGDAGAAIDACEAVLAESGGLQGALAQQELPLVEQIYGAILRGPDRVPVHGAATPDLDPRAAFLLSRIDGAMTVEDVLDVSGMPRLEALRGLALLVRRGAVVIK